MYGIHIPLWEAHFTSSMQNSDVNIQTFLDTWHRHSASYHHYVSKLHPEPHAQPTTAFIYSPVRFTVMLTFAELAVWHLRLFVKEAPFKDASEVLVVLVNRSVPEIVPVNAIDYRHCHDGSIEGNTTGILTARLYEGISAMQTVYFLSETSKVFHRI